MQKLVTAMELSYRIATGKAAIAERWVAKVQRVVPAAREHGFVFIKDHLEIVLDRLCGFLQKPCDTVDLARGIRLADKHGTQRASSPSYRSYDLATEYSLLRETITDLMHEGELLDQAASNLLSTFNEISLAHSLEEFIKKSESVFHQYESRQRETQDVANQAMASQEIAEIAQRQHQDFLMQAPAPMCILMGPEHVFTIANSRYCEFIGSNPINRPVREVFSPDEGAGFIEILDQVYLTGEPYVGKEVVYKRKIDGVVENVLVDFVYQPVRDNVGKTIGIFAYLTDVTEQVRARNKLLESQIYFRDLVDSSPAMIWITDSKSQCTYLSKQWYEFTGRTPEQDLGVGWLENIHPDDLPETRRVYANAIDNKGPLRVDYRVRKKSGEYRWAVDLGYPRFDSEGNFVGYIGTVTDIHERIAIERELRETQLRFNRSSEATDLGVWYCDLPFDELIWNKEVKEHFFMPEDARVTIGDFYERIHPEDREMTRVAIQNSIEKNASYDIVYRTTNPNKPSDVKFIRAIGWTDYDNNGAPIRFDGITLDVTLQRHAQEELHAAKSTAERANAAKSQFLANMSHEIRTPLGAIMGFVSLLGDQTLSRPEFKSFLAIIERNSTQLLRIIDDILDLSKVEAGMMLIESIDFSLPELLTDFSSLMGFRAREKGINFGSRAVTKLPDFICGDPTRIRQILMNVVGNAIKFTERGRVDLDISYRDGQLEFSVKDTGPGISLEQEQNLFQPFSQADTSVTRKFGGTGLGLVLTRSLCEAMGGTFVLKESRLGGGSTFVATVRVALLEKTEFENTLGFSSDPVRPSHPVGQLDGVKVLLVEDSPDNQALISIFLKRTGALVDIASDGGQGFKKAIEGHYDVVLMDVQMPIMDGITAVTKMRAAKYEGCVIALTAHAMKEERIRCLEAGFDRFLSKPIQRADLIEALLERCGKPPPHSGVT